MPYEDKRKLIPIGKSSFAVILPKGWVRFNKLAAGDKLKVVCNGSVSIEAPEKRKTPKS